MNAISQPNDLLIWGLSRLSKLSHDRIARLLNMPNVNIDDINREYDRYITRYKEFLHSPRINNPNMKFVLRLTFCLGQDADLYKYIRKMLTIKIGELNNARIKFGEYTFLSQGIVVTIMVDNGQRALDGINNESIRYAAYLMFVTTCGGKIEILPAA